MVENLTPIKISNHSENFVHNCNWGASKKLHNINKNEITKIDSISSAENFSNQEIKISQKNSELFGAIVERIREKSKIDFSKDIQDKIFPIPSVEDFSNQKIIMHKKTPTCIDLMKSSSNKILNDIMHVQEIKILKDQVEISWSSGLVQNCTIDQIIENSIDVPAIGDNL